MKSRIFDYFARTAFGLIVFTVLATAILLQPPKFLLEFDQLFYVTLGYDLEHHGVLSNGVFDDVDSTVGIPPPGKFFGPIYPWLVAASMRLDHRFAQAIDCAVGVNEGMRKYEDCEMYATPVLLMHAALLTLGVLAVALSAEIIFTSAAMFWLTGILATIALLPDVDLFSFVMTESLTFGLYGLAALALVAALKIPRMIAILLAGALFGLLALTRASFVVVAPAAVALIAINDLWLARTGWRSLIKHALAFSLAWTAVVGPWLARNAISTGEWRLSEEYGSATLIERFAYDDMTAREFALAFPYCLPAAGQPLIETLFGPKTMARFIFSEPGSFFHTGRAHREQLVERHHKLDPIIGDVIRDEMRERWWRYLLVSLPLGWCGLWVGGLLGLALARLFVWGCVTAVRRREPLFLLYATPPLVMLALHAALANQYTRYNLILIGPFAAATAWFLVEKTRRYLMPTPAPRLRS
jgi:hypothetical protein